PLHDLWENGEEVWADGQYFTDLVTERAVRYVRRAARSGQPFFLYVPYNAPHYPMHAPQHYKVRFPDLPWGRQIMAAMLSAVDDGVGAIVAELERRGIRDNTCIVFQSDNGPSRETRNWLDGRADPYYGGTAGKLKGHKFSLYEGGIRSPAIMSWPARIPAGQVIEEPGAAMDVFPTFLKAAGGDPSAYELDGQDVLPMVADGAPSPHAELFWEMGRQTAIRRGNWKLVLHGQLVEGAPPEDDVFLADLSTDLAERANLRDTHPRARRRPPRRRRVLAARDRSPLGTGVAAPNHRHHLPGLIVHAPTDT
ncbi:MAG: sulfatase family protein, partial [Chloroflexota bacterium]